MLAHKWINFSDRISIHTFRKLVEIYAENFSPNFAIETLYPFVSASLLLVISMIAIFDMMKLNEHLVSNIATNLAMYGFYKIWKCRMGKLCQKVYSIVHIKLMRLF